MISEITQKTAMRPVMSQKMQGAVQILQLTREELIERIELELETNPVLEIKEPDSLEKERDLSNDEKVKEISVSEEFKEDVEWSYYENEFYDEKSNKDFSITDNIPSYVSLHEYLLCQFAENFPSQEKEEKRGIAEFIIMNIDRDGYLKVTKDEITDLMETDIEKVEKTIKDIQSLEPAGVCARDLKESLLLQAERLKDESGILKKIIENHLEDMGSYNLKNISDSLNIDIETANYFVKIIKEFSPYPGRKFFQNETYDENIKFPDIIIKESEGKFHIELNKSQMPILGINKLYEKLLSSDENKNTKDYIRQKLNSALWFLKCIEMRENTIIDIVKSIIHLQRDFFINGIYHLKPLTLNDVAKNIDKHESTVSRAIRNKYLYCKHGIFELKKFFDSSLKNRELVSVVVKNEIKKIIKKEDKKKPYSDDTICQILQTIDINIKRRTVAKYRKDMKIPGASVRKKSYKIY